MYVCKSKGRKRVGGKGGGREGRKEARHIRERGRR